MADDNEMYTGGTASGRRKLNKLQSDVDILRKLRGDGVFIVIEYGIQGGAIVKLNLASLLARVAHPGIDTFPVKVTNDGGSAGGPTTLCSFTYTVTDLDGTLLKKDAAGTDATGMTPEFNMRGTKGLMVAAPDNSYGQAFYDSDDLILWMTTEQPATGTGTCP
jgi:hypothetical protein